MLSKLKSKNYFQDESGNVAIMFAVTLTSLLLCTGAALDLTDLNSRKLTLQSATDAAVLAAAVSGETNLKDLEVVAKTIFKENFTLKKSESVKDFKLSLSDENELNLTTRIEKPTILMGIAGIDVIDAEVEATTFLMSKTPLDIALVLDRTGSMAGPNIKGLINASRGFINEMTASGRDVRIAVVPFSDYVNIGVNGLSSSLLDIPGSALAGSDVVCTMETTATNTCPTTSSPTTSTTPDPWGIYGAGYQGYSGYSYSGYSAYSGFSDSTLTWYDVSSSSTGAFCTISSDPQENSGSQVEECTPSSVDENWFGCVGSRAAPFNKVVGAGGEKFPLMYNRTCGEPLVQLTDDLVKARMSIDRLTASGSTYIPAGLQWGWRALDPTGPFKSNLNSNSNSKGPRQKLLILMTDGENTRSQDGALHTGTDIADANALSAELCEEIKASDIQIATVSYSNGSNGGGNMAILRRCASSASLFYEARNAQALQKAFKGATEQSSSTRLIR